MPRWPVLSRAGGQGVHREVESEGHEENCRAGVEGAIPYDEPVGQRWGKCRACTMEAKAFLIHPPYQGVCGLHGREDQCVTPGGLMRFPGGSGISDPISLQSEVGSDAV